jgi:hypothetical protein
MSFEDATLAVEPYLRKLQECSSATEIRDFLVSEQIQATPGRVDGCALAAYLREKSGVDVCVHGGGVWMPEFEKTISVSVDGSLSVALDHFPRHTQSMMDFVRNFDNGLYPELTVAA